MKHIDLYQNSLRVFYLSDFISWAFISISQAPTAKLFIVMGRLIRTVFCLHCRSHVFCWENNGINRKTTAYWNYGSFGMMYRLIASVIATQHSTSYQAFLFEGAFIKYVYHSMWLMLMSNLLRHRNFFLFPAGSSKSKSHRNY